MLAYDNDCIPDGLCPASAAQNAIANTSEIGDIGVYYELYLVYSLYDVTSKHCRQRIAREIHLSTVIIARNIRSDTSTILLTRRNFTDCSSTFENRRISRDRIDRSSGPITVECRHNRFSSMTMIIIGYVPLISMSYWNIGNLY